ncbi:hypothetical protein O181_120197 [Austropuccinia psidii MF-1]|uniref:Uncharacterized protein n=1 Tax=Austropuccinia psidii MF-1 TaxID=1389203 RepID=A0A9Q3KGK8_9BASI|nr:hypothetical protein [Austropuccinia psidii MF-1]
MLTLLHRPQDMLLWMPPISALTHPYSSAYLLRPQDIPPMSPSPLLRLPPTCLMLSPTYHPYAPAVPSRCDSNSATPSPPSPLPTILMLPQPPHDMPPTPPPHLCTDPSLCLCTPTTYHPYAPILDP